ncbi:MAG: hypothetical protein GXO48_04040 [Chlorobi bacterium]|nr:hypothetical protein [Chlorobiota bacterium]
MKTLSLLLKLTFIGIVLSVAMWNSKNSMVVSYSSTPPAGMTGAPGDGTCATCHGGGTLQTTDSVIITFYDTIPNPDTVVQAYEVGKTYRVVVQVNSSWATRFGFEMTALDSSGNPAGSFVLLNSANTAIQTSGGRQYVSHRNASSNNTWEFLWNAPTNQVGGVVFYFAVNFANNNGATSGDAIYVGNTVLPILLTPAQPDLVLYNDTLHACVNTQVQVNLIYEVLGSDITTAKIYVEERIGNTITLDSITLANLTVGGPNSVPIKTITVGTDTIYYKLWVGATNPAQLSNGDTAYITVLPIEPISAVVINGPDTVLVGQAATFQATISGQFDSVVWNVQGASQNTYYGVGPHSISWQTTGTYTIEVTAFNKCGSLTTTKSVFVQDTTTVSVQLPEPSFLFSGCIFEPSGKLINCFENTPFIYVLKNLEAGIYLIKHEGGRVSKIYVSKAMR